MTGERAVDDLASQLAKHWLRHVRREHPKEPDHVLNGAADLISRARCLRFSSVVSTGTLPFAPRGETQTKTRWHG